MLASIFWCFYTEEQKRQYCANEAIKAVQIQINACTALSNKITETSYIGIESQTALLHPDSPEGRLPKFQAQKAVLEKMRDGNQITSDEKAKVIGLAEVKRYACLHEYPATEHEPLLA